ncbi:hypothetical protein Zmor_025904 [Zophobas morio]|uniref:Uncharacterized protein n=1 Tax=Zophobas morio TaxID=2755281 RepID=A0AA38M506_9CUCU|nr:hypothetical protein Zmor_025904 [Zophobas morio]
MAALALYEHYNISRTDSSRPWGVRLQKVDQLRPELLSLKVFFNSQVSPKTANVEERFQESLRHIDGGKGLLWLFGPEPESSEEI